MKNKRKEGYGVALWRPKIPQPTGLGMMYLPLKHNKDTCRGLSPSRPRSVVDQLFE